MKQSANFKLAEEKALEILERNHIQSPPIPVEDLVEFEGLGIIRSHFADGGISGVIDLEKKYLYVNVEDSTQRQRFTIAHEFGHWLLHQQQMKDDKSLAVFYRRSIFTREDQDNNIWEQEADCFAANLLVPALLLKQAIEGEKIFDDAALAQKFDVSRLVIGYRRKFLRV